MINLKSVLPFWIVLVLNFCALLVLGWGFGPSTGYGLIANWGNIWLVLCAIFSIFNLILILLMLTLSVWGVARNGKGAELKIGSWNMQAIIEFLMLMFALVSVLIFVFSSASVGFVSFGAILYVVLVWAIVITYMILRQKNIIQKQVVLERFLNIEQKNSKQKTKNTTKKQPHKKEWLPFFFSFAKI